MPLVLQLDQVKIQKATYLTYLTNWQKLSFTVVAFSEWSQKIYTTPVTQDLRNENAVHSIQWIP